MQSNIKPVSQTNKLKIFNDPIYGFITIPNEFIYDLIQHPYFQRLRRISQMGLSYLVYPGAHHTRFHHALGAMHLMQKAVEVLRHKAIDISTEEETALYAAILLHDVGHGPFSHALEQSLMEVHHETLSLRFMQSLNEAYDGKLDMAIAMFKGTYPRKFMTQLISSQLDMDRMDYLKRDSFYSGVAEGNINSDRLIQMMTVVNDSLVMEEKSIYSIEKFLLARRLMYWQAYLHKTSLAAELMLTQVLKRARKLAQSGVQLPCSPALGYFLHQNLTEDDFTPEVLTQFSHLDDYDVMSALKAWQWEGDFILKTLSAQLVNRDLFKVTLTEEKTPKEIVNTLKEKIATVYDLSAKEANYFVYSGKIKNQAYNKEAEPIMMIKKDKSVQQVTEHSESLNSRALSHPDTKYYLCYPKDLL